MDMVFFVISYYTLKINERANPPAMLGRIV